MDYTKRENNRVEVWKDIKEYEGLYQSSTFGRARSLDRWVKGPNGSIRLCKGKILKPGTTKNGYLQVNLYKNGKGKNFLVHRLVAEAFIPNPYNLPQVNHKDENKLNNCVSNLEWCTNLYNHNYGTINERISQSQSKPVLQYTLDGEFVKEWASAKQAEKEGGFHQGNVVSCCRGKRKKHKDSIWRYK